jgi:hypothetical protein
MPQDLILPHPAADGDGYEDALRILRDHLLGAVEVDREIGLNGRAYVVAWADRRVTDRPAPRLSLASGMGVRDAGERAEVVPTGEEQITVVVDGERLVFHLVEAGDEAPDRRNWRKALR